LINLGKVKLGAAKAKAALANLVKSIKSSRLNLAIFALCILVIGALTTALLYRSFTPANSSNENPSKRSLLSSSIPTISFSASPPSVKAGQSSMLTWNALGAKSCKASGDWNGDKTMSGHASTSTLSKTSTFNLACVGSGGTSVASTAVIVTVSLSSQNPASQIKPPTVGLIDRSKLPNSLFSAGGNIDTFIVNAYWKDLQPTQDGALVHPNAIDTAISKATAAGPNFAIKIRFFAGIWAPNWAKSVGGPAFCFFDPNGGTATCPNCPAGSKTCGMIGRFWTADYKAAYDNIMAQLAAAYDNNPIIHDVTMSRCMTIYAEPFQRSASAQSNRAALINAGFTDTADKQCFKDQIDTANVWQRTRSSLAFNPYQDIVSTASFKGDEVFTESIMDYCRQVLGTRCVLENNSIRAPITSLGDKYASMYAHMKNLGPPITLQTATIDRIGCFMTSLDCASKSIAQGTLDWAVTEGANAVEMPSGYDGTNQQTKQPLYAPSNFATYDKLLEANRY
jgi:hypothetical protein